MHSRAVRIKKLGLLTIRPLRRGETETIAALFDRLCTNGAKSRLSDADLTQLATVDSRRHTLVAYADGDSQPAGIAQLVRDPHRWTHAQIIVAVADCYHGLRIGSALLELLAADARAAGITELTDTMPASAVADALVQEASLEPRPRAGRRSRGAAIA
jgi:GNAT superfamily N-acetyltransferase